MTINSDGILSVLDFATVRSVKIFISATGGVAWMDSLAFVAQLTVTPMLVTNPMVNFPPEFNTPIINQNL